MKSISKVKIISTTILLISIVLLSFLSSCQYIIQLPENVGKGGKYVRKDSSYYVYDKQLLANADNKNILNILVSTGPESMAASEITQKFKNLYGMECNVVETDWDKIREIMMYDMGRLSPKDFPPGAIDVVFMPSTYIGEYVDSFINFDDLVERDSFDTNDYFPGLFDLISKFRGSIKGIPVKSSIDALVFRSGAFPEGRILNYDEYYRYLEKFKDDNLYEYPVLFDGSELNNLWLNRFWSLGGKTTTEDWEITINNEIGYKSLEMLQKLASYSSKDIFVKSYEDIGAEFISRKSMVFEGNPDFLFTKYIEMLNLRDTSVEEKYLDISIMPVPSGENGNFSKLSSMVMCIPKDSKKTEMAWEWIKLYTSKENSKLFLNKFGLLSPKISVFEDPELNKKYTFLKNIYDLYKKDTGIKTDYRIKGSWDIWEVMLNKYLKESLINNESPKETIEKIQEEWENLLNLAVPSKEFKYKE